MFVPEQRDWDHCRPIYEALYPSERGTLYVGSRIPDPPPDAVRGRPPHTGGPILVASWGAYRYIARRPVVFLEHGAGQAYKSQSGEWDRNPSNPGGRERDGVVLFLCTNISVADRNLAAYPHSQVAVVGSPRLDSWHDQLIGGDDSALTNHIRIGETHDRGRPVVSLSFRWECGQVPESKSALHHYLPALSGLLDHYIVLGHGHPRAWRHLEKTYERLGIRPVRDFKDVIAEADLLIVDNSSAGPEFMAVTDRPILWLNSPRYRRDVHHGGRFWSWTDGSPTCDNPADLDLSIIEALSDPPHVQRRRREIVAEVYADTLGRATDLCLLAIRELGRSEGWL